MRSFVFSCLLFIVALVPCSGQRTARGQFFADVEGVYSFSSFGAAVSFGQYVNPGYWSASVLGVNRLAGLQASGSTSDLDYAHVGAAGDFMYRLFSTDSRSLSFYTGGGLFLGAEIPDPFQKKPNDGVIPVGTKFIYALVPGLCLEFFPAGRFAIVGKFRLPVNFSSSFNKVNYEVALAARLNF